MRIFLIFLLVHFFSFSAFAEEEIQEEDTITTQEEAVPEEDPKEDQVLAEDFPVLSGEARQMEENSENTKEERISNHSLKVGLVLFALAAIGLSFSSKGHKKNI